MQDQTTLIFPAGAILTVIRAPEFDPHGDGTYTPHHTIGPCDIAMSAASHHHGGGHEVRAPIFIEVSAPAGSDIKKTDRVQLPSGVICKVLAEPLHPVNPFTGWVPFVSFQLVEIS